MTLEAQISRIALPALQEAGQPVVVPDGEVDWSVDINRMSLNLLPQTPREVLDVLWAPIYIGYKVVRYVIPPSGRLVRTCFNYGVYHKVPELEDLGSKFVFEKMSV